RYDDGDTTRDTAFARELVALRPDLLATNGGVTAVALSAATTTIPIIASGILAATLDELVGTNVARPSANVTGIVSDSVALVAKHCELALELVPSAKRLGILVFSLDVDGGAAVRAAASAAAAALKVALVPVDVGQP